MVLFLILGVHKVFSHVEGLKLKIDVLEAEIELLKNESIMKNEKVEEKIATEEKNKTKYTHNGVFRVTAYCACEKCCGKWATVNGRRNNCFWN